MSEVSIDEGKKKRARRKPKAKGVGIDTPIPGNPNPPAKSKVKQPVHWEEPFPCVLTTEEMAAKAALADQTLDEIEELEAQKKAATAHIKAKIDGKRAEFREIRRVRKTGSEERSVEVYEEFVFSTNTVKIVRSDTGEVVRERAMRIDERQEALPLGRTLDAVGEDVAAIFGGIDAVGEIEEVDVGAQSRVPDEGPFHLECTIRHDPSWELATSPSDKIDEGPEITAPQAVLDAEDFGTDADEGL